MLWFIIDVKCLINAWGWIPIISSAFSEKSCKNGAICWDLGRHLVVSGLGVDLGTPFQKFVVYLVPKHVFPVQAFFQVSFSYDVEVWIWTPGIWKACNWHGGNFVDSNFHFLYFWKPWALVEGSEMGLKFDASSWLPWKAPDPAPRPGDGNAALFGRALLSESSFCDYFDKLLSFRGIFLRF